MIAAEEKEYIRHRLLTAGACAVGFARADKVEEKEWGLFQQWLEGGDNAGMDYMHNYPDLRSDPRGLLEGAKTVISLAFSYKPEKFRPSGQGIIASYAYGKDYHKVLRKLLKLALQDFEEKFGDASYRICVDSAPILERYWAVKAGVGYRGDNGCVIVPGYGSMVFLAEILTDLEIGPDTPLNLDCGHCGACIRSCPGNALGNSFNCKKCISYLTIEHRGDWDKNGKEVMKNASKEGTILGCEVCLRVCPHNRKVPATEIASFKPVDELWQLTPEIIREIAARDDAEEEFRRRFPGSALSRAGLRGLIRNISQ